MTHKTILLDHGSGGKLSNDLVSELIVPLFDNTALSSLHDGAVLKLKGTQIAFSTDSYVVDPLFFPGGSIGDLAVNGTVNDIAMCGAMPVALSCGLIIEEGLETDILKQVLSDMKKAADGAGVAIVTGDTKVVPKGAADKLFINTSGVGVISHAHTIDARNASPGDVIILSGTIADHGMTILNQRENLLTDSPLKSDSAPLNHMVKTMLDTGKPIHVLRDPTRGGLGTTLNEIAEASNTTIQIDESAVPINKETTALCDLLGIDPLYVANEGKLIAIVPETDAPEILKAIKQSPYGSDAAIIGRVTPQSSHAVILNTAVGGKRIVSMLTGEQLPRIC